MNNTTAIYRTIPKECSLGVSEALTVVLSMVSLLALTGNFLVILTFIKTVSLKTSSNYYIVNMAASDLVCVLLNWPLYATEGMLKPGGSLITDTTLASFSCKLGIYSRSVSYVVSILSLVLIAVDRFIATAFPLKALHKSGRTRKIFLLLSWFFPALAFIPYVVYSRIIEIEKQSFCRNMMSGFLRKIYFTLGFVFFYCTPLILVLVLYPRIAKHLRATKTKLENSKRILASKRLKQSRNIMKIFGSIVLGFFICWTPHYAYLFLKSFYPSIFRKDTCRLLVGLFYYFFPLLSTALNPFILIIFSSSYRGAVKSLICSCLFRKRRSRRVAQATASPQGENLETFELK